MKYQQGFSITEVLIASSIMTVAAFSAASMMAGSFKTNEHSKEMLVSNQIYNQVIEEIQSVSYDLVKAQGTEPNLSLGQTKVTILDSTSKTVSLDRSMAYPMVTGDILVVGDTPNESTYPRYIKLNNIEYRIDLVVEKGTYNNLAALPSTHQGFLKNINRFLLAPAMAAQSNGSVSIQVGPSSVGYKNTTEFQFSVNCNNCPPVKHRTYKWNFGVGENSSFDAAPGKIFSQSSKEQRVFLTVGDKRFSDVALTAETFVDVKDSKVQITMSPENPQTGQTVSFSANCESDENSDCGLSPEYHWTFGDGSSASGQAVSHIYNESSDYTATVSVSGGTDPSATQGVTVAPKAGNQTTVEVAPQNTGIAGPATHQDTTHFEITMGSQGYENAQTVVYTVGFGDQSDPVTVVDENPGDSDFPKTQHSYEQGGTYQVTVVSSPQGLTAEDGGPLTTTTSTNIVAKSQLGISANKTQVNVGETVLFETTVLGAGDNPSYHWDFGDSQVISQDYSGYAGHTFTKSGVYTVTLQATGGSNPSASKEITVLNAQTTENNQSHMKKIQVKVAKWSETPPEHYLSNAVVFKAKNGDQ